MIGAGECLGTIISCDVDGREGLCPLFLYVAATSGVVVEGEAYGDVVDHDATAAVGQRKTAGYGKQAAPVAADD